MSRTLGTVVRGVRAPIFREGDSVVDITVSTVLNALAENNITARHRHGRGEDRAAAELSL